MQCKKVKNDDLLKEILSLEGELMFYRMVVSFKEIVEEGVEYDFGMFVFKKMQGECGGGVVFKENVCQNCEKLGELLLCEVQCCGVFYLECFGLIEMLRGKFICNECCIGIYICFVCKQSGEDVKRCFLFLCGKFYYEECVQKYLFIVMQNKGFWCFFYICIICYVVNLVNVFVFKG